MARAISEVHRQSWQQAYAGLIPYQPLMQMLERRGELWRKKAARSSAMMLVVEMAGVIVGYATLGLSRARALPHDGEIYELYLRPEYQGIRLGSLLFMEAGHLLTSLGYNGIVVWCLEESDVANRFFRSHGGRDAAEGMKILCRSVAAQDRFRLELIWTLLPPRCSLAGDSQEIAIISSPSLFLSFWIRQCVLILTKLCNAATSQYKKPNPIRRIEKSKCVLQMRTPAR